MSARPGGNLAADMVRITGKAGEAGKPGQWTVSVTFCRGCRYLGCLGGGIYCNYAGITGKPRTVRNGKKVDMCPRKRKGKPAGGALEAELLRLRDELEQTPDGRRTLADIRTALAVMRTLGLSWEMARLYVDGSKKG